MPLYLRDTKPKKYKRNARTGGKADLRKLRKITKRRPVMKTIKRSAK